MTLSLIRGRWVAFGAVLLLGLLLVACGSTTPASAPNTQAQVPTIGVTSETKELSADNPVVVLPPNEDLERRKELAALLPSSTDSNTDSAAPTAKADASASAVQSDQTGKDATGQESQQPKNPVVAPAVENPVAEAPALLLRSGFMVARSAT